MSEGAKETEDALIGRIAFERAALISVAVAALEASLCFGAGFDSNSPAYSHGDKVRRELWQAVNALPKSIINELREARK